MPGAGPTPHGGGGGGELAAAKHAWPVTAAALPFLAGWTLLLAVGVRVPPPSPPCTHICLLTALQKKAEEINRRSADMWSFAVLLWELVTREVPFADLSNMEIGMKVSRSPGCPPCTPHSTQDLLPHSKLCF